MSGDIEIYIVGFVLMIVFISIVYATFFGFKSPQSIGSYQTQSSGQALSCKTDADCYNSKNGLKCLLTYPGDNIPFCGCVTSADCGDGLCGSNSKCS